MSALPADARGMPGSDASQTTRLWKWLSRGGPYAPLIAMCLGGLVLLSLSRLALMGWQAERVAANGIWMTMLVQGVRVDLIQLGLLSAFPVLLAPVTAFLRTWQWWRRFAYLWVIGSIALLLFLEVATPAFIAEYDTRPNRFFIEYLKYPREVFSMLWGGYRLQLLAGLALTIAGTYAASVMMRPWLVQPRRWSPLTVCLTWPFIVLLVAATIRSTTDHRPANPAMFALTPDTMVNSLILNSAWSVAHAAYGLKHEARSSEIYGTMESAEMLSLVRASQARAEDVFEALTADSIPTLSRLVPSVARERPLNLVIVLEESLGATFVESLGGVAATPELEKLKHEGWWFEQLYATGTRSVRGIEAVVTGFPPTPAQSVVKLSLAQQKFFSLASLLQRKGYHTEFIYGGESHFDNMRSFFTGNGFVGVVDQNDFEAPVFKGSWGVSDEDLFGRTHEQLTAHHQSGKPFFTLVFTSSNHSPFEFPDGRIELHDPEKATERNAVKYADHALGRFFAQARASDYWHDTLFLVVADHDIRVRGESLVPIERFHIPGLILGADLTPRRIRTVASQIDLAPTLLSLMGIEAEHPMIGRDLSAEPASRPGRAMMQFEQNYAWMEGNDVVILRPQKEPVRGRYDAARKSLHATLPTTLDDPLARTALAHVLLPSWLYREQRYRLPHE